LPISGALAEDVGVEWRLLQGVPEDDLRGLLQLARRRRFRRGEVVFHRDDPADSLHLVVTGRFAVRVMTPLGDQATIAVRGPGDSFGEMALVGQPSRRSATVEALEAAETFCVYQAEFARLRRDHPQVNELLISFLSNEVRMLNERLLEALYVPVERRVLRRLHELAAVYGHDTEDQVEIPLTQEEIAGLAGSARGTVNAVLREAQASGLLELRRGKTLVLDRDELARRAR
jgi:CRP/FNR family cyclic AMP-dependent transcriptional regulator